MKEIDFTHRGWGHNLVSIDSNPSDKYPHGIYQCICTPGPEVGDVAIAPGGSRWEFMDVKAMRNPRDLYHVGLKRIDP